jgi:hypothetical protein
MMSLGPGRRSRDNCAVEAEYMSPRVLVAWEEKLPARGRVGPAVVQWWCSGGAAVVYRPTVGLGELSHGA